MWFPYGGTTEQVSSFTEMNVVRVSRSFWCDVPANIIEMTMLLSLASEYSTD